eukprot:4342156-Heterocapsa_arctica.AAC.1
MPVSIPACLYELAWNTSYPLYPWLVQENEHIHLLLHAAACIAMPSLGPTARDRDNAEIRLRI